MAMDKKERSMTTNPDGVDFLIIVVNEADPGTGSAILLFKIFFDPFEEGFLVPSRLGFEVG